jgi:hypothetical protein
MWINSTVAALPLGVSVTVNGDFDPGASGGTAVNSPTQSTLSIGTATLVYNNSDISAFVAPGGSIVVSLGNLTTAAGDLNPVSFSGALLNLTVQITDPPAAPAVGVLPLAITGNVGVSGETVTFTASSTENEVDFLAQSCVQKIVSMVVDPVTTVMSGDPPADIGATLTVVYGQPVVAGDVDGDGSVTLVDAVRALFIASGLDQGQCDEIERGDIAGTGVLDLTNAVLIARASYGL